MRYTFFHIVRFALLTLLFTADNASSEEQHAVEALKHADQAATSGDSKAIGEHAAEALKHIQAAKTAPGAGEDQHLRHGEADLDSAVQHSRWYNTDRAAHEAEDAKAHLEAIER